MAQGECPAAPGQTERSEVPGEYVIQTAILSKRTDVYAANEPRGFRRAARNNEKKSRVDSRAMGLERFLSQMINRGNVEAANDPPVSRLPLAILPKDTQVELAEDDTTDLPESVHVIVPGCGLGIVPKAHLKEITTHQFPGRRASCITALSYEASVGDGTVATKIVRELLVDVRDVRVYPPLAFSEGSVPHDNVIESIDCYQFTAESSEWMQRLNRLHSLGLSCTSDQLHQLLSAIQSALTARPLRALRLTVDVLDSSNGDWKQSLASLSTAIGGKLKRLQVFEIGFRHRGALPDLDVEMDQFKSQLPPVHPSLAIGKLTFLWALRTWRPQCTAALDSYVIATIFAYCGRSMTRVVITRLPLGMRFSLAPRNQVV